MKKILMIMVIALLGGGCDISWGQIPTIQLGGGLLQMKEGDTPPIPGVTVGLCIRQPKLLNIGILSDFYFHDEGRSTSTFILGGVNFLYRPFNRGAYVGGGFGLTNLGIRSQSSQGFINGVVGGDAKVNGKARVFIQGKLYRILTEKTDPKWGAGFQVGISAIL